MPTELLFIPESYTPTGEFADELAILADTLLVETFGSEARQQGFYVPFSSRRWKRMFHASRYTKIKQAAITSGMIEVNERYSVDNFSKSIRLRNEHRDGRFKEYRLTKTKRPSFRNRNIDFESLGDIGRWLVGHFSQFRFNETARAERCLEIPQVRLGFRKIENQGWHAKRCGFGKRFHSNFTNLKSELRKHLLIHGRNERTAAIDITACQPLMLGLTVKNGYDIGTEDLTKLGKQWITTCGANHDVHEWIDFCEKGRIYEEIQEWFKSGYVAPQTIHTDKGYSFPSDPHDFDRKDVKKSLIVAMFQPARDMIDNAAFQVMLAAFPSIAGYMVLVKQQDHKRLAKACQRMESRIMIDGVCGELMRTHPYEPILTVHDEIICGESHVPTVVSCIQRQFARFGTNVHVKAELKGTDWLRAELHGVTG